MNQKWETFLCSANNEVRYAPKLEIEQTINWKTASNQREREREIRTHHTIYRYNFRSHFHAWLIWLVCASCVRLHEFRFKYIIFDVRLWTCVSRFLFSQHVSNIAPSRKYKVIKVIWMEANCLSISVVGSTEHQTQFCLLAWIVVDLTEHFQAWFFGAEEFIFGLNSSI